MMKRRRERIGQRRRQQRNRWLRDLPVFSLLVCLVAGVVYGGKTALDVLSSENDSSDTSSLKKTIPSSQKEEVQTVRIMAHGDLLYHDIIYWSAQQPDGQYDFTENFTYVKPWIAQADFAVADFEGTISSDYPLSGYPLFNAPTTVANAIQ